MPLKAVVAKLDDVPEAVRDQYEARDGAFHLKLEGEIPGFVPAVRLGEVNTRLDEFRSNNKRLLQALGVENVDDAVARLSALREVDPAKYKALEQKVAELEKGGVKDAGDVQVRIQRAVDEALQGVQGTISKLQATVETSEREKKAAEERLARKDMETSFSSIGFKAGLEERALTDYLGRVRQTWSLVDGKLVAKNGDTPIMSKTTGHPVTPEEWVRGLTEEAPHLFKASAGSGAPPAPGQSGGTPPRSDQKTLINPTPQELGRHADDIASGKIRVVSQAS